MFNAPDEKEMMNYYLIGKSIKKESPLIAEMLADDYDANTPVKIAKEVAELFPKTYKRFEEIVKDELEEWWDQLESLSDPVLDKHHYHMPQL